MNYQRELIRQYMGRASQIGNEILNGVRSPIGINSSGHPLAFHLDGVIDAVYGGFNGLRKFFDECTRIPSPIEMTFPGIDSIEVIAHQSRDYPPVPQITYPTHVQNGWRPDIDYNAPNGSSKNRRTQQYSGETRVRNNVRYQKKSHRVVETIRQTRLRKRKLPHRNYSSVFR